LQNSVKAWAHFYTTSSQKRSLQSYKTKRRQGLTATHLLSKQKPDPPCDMLRRQDHLDQQCNLAGPPRAWRMEDTQLYLVFYVTTSYEDLCFRKQEHSLHTIQRLPCISPLCHPLQCTLILIYFSSSIPTIIYFAKDLLWHFSWRQRI